jgi:site-specific DNA-cytosine methylase
VTQHHYPDTIQLGDITNWKNWNLPQIDLIIGGSPCQGFAFAGKGLNFEDERSKLFFVFVDSLKHYKPRFFLLENVKMKKEWEHIITCYIGIKPIEINSALVSAQNRKRLYWTNISDIRLPEDKHIYLKDIIEHGEVNRQKSYTIDANYYKGGSLNGYLERSRRQNNLSPRQSERRLSVKGAAFRKHPRYKNGEIRNKQLEIRNDDKFNCLTEIETDSVLLKLVAAKRGQDRKGQRIYSADGKFSSIDSIGELNGFTNDNITWRKLTPIECERLQTVPDNYTNLVSNTQRYKMLGNGWTVDVIAHIFKILPQNLDAYRPYVLPDYKPTIVIQESLF